MMKWLFLIMAAIELLANGIGQGDEMVTRWFRSGDMGVAARINLPQPSILEQPGDIEGFAGTTAFTTATGENIGSAEWYYNSGSGWQRVGDGVEELYSDGDYQTAKYTTPILTAERNGWLYRCTLRNGGNRLDSNTITLLVSGF